jgi:hypothetical protein
MPEIGQRIFVHHNGKYYLLGIPSAYEMGLNFADGYTSSTAQFTK